MVSLVMAMFDELVDELAYMSLAKRDHATETLLFDRADEPLGIGVEIGTLRWQPNRLDTATRQREHLNREQIAGGQAVPMRL